MIVWPSLPAVDVLVAQVVTHAAALRLHSYIGRTVKITYVLPRRGKSRQTREVASLYLGLMCDPIRT